jgi:hypothetical protein
MVAPNISVLTVQDSDSYVMFTFFCIFFAQRE